VSSNSISESEWVEYYKSLLDNNSSDLTRAEPTLGTAQTPSPLDFPFKRIHKNRKLYFNFNFSKAI
jgi:hypothetical protein